jgi:hypothetical protein
MRMGTSDLVEHDPPACPLLGLAADHRSHFSYPHPGHRCFAGRRPAPTDAAYQARFCLTAGYASCVRYVTWQKRSREARGAADRHG